VLGTWCRCAIGKPPIQPRVSAIKKRGTVAA
jgi:hypothetical protein